MKQKNQKAKLFGKYLIKKIKDSCQKYKNILFSFLRINYDDMLEIPVLFLHFY